MIPSDNNLNGEKTLKEGTDYIFDKRGFLVFTREYLLKRGYCCKNNCTNCPYQNPENRK